ncbi:MAG: hypothetical protein A2231_12360 [Candidatus Firestonebacteria bacterium RIFOXYA2_FULL_40_8]|nr:MAG: hypothetical protein A2231_12360 [Candidatus Firestonebacteria bacterium RIFOXYA2_FULL_40_8]
MKKHASLLMLTYFIFTFTTFFLITRTIDDFISLETKKRQNFRVEWLKNELSKYSLSEDDIMLNNSLEILLKHEEVLKITISEKGRVIADTDPSDINTKTDGFQKLTPEEENKNILIQHERYSFSGKEYILTLKTNNNLIKPLKYSLKLKLGTSYFVLLLITCFLFFRSSSKEQNIPVSAPQKDSEPLINEDILLNSTSAIVLVLSGDNKILRASKRAFEVFNPAIEGKLITELLNYQLVAEYFSAGRKPFIKDGKKYLIF